MLSTIGYVILFAIGGTLLATVWTFLIGFGGVPGAALACKLVPNENWHDGSRNVSMLALTLCVIGQSYAALAFCALAVGFTSDLLAKRSDLIGWIIWIVAFCVSTLPASFAAKDAAKKLEKKTQDVAITFTFAIGSIGFWIFVIFPTVMKAGWGWMPYVNGH